MTRSQSGDSNNSNVRLGIDVHIETQRNSVSDQVSKLRLRKFLSWIKSFTHSHAGIGLNHVKRIFNRKPECLTETPISSVENSKAQSL